MKGLLLLTWLMTKKINKVRPVHINFWLKGTLVSGCWTSGKNATKGFARSRNLTEEQNTMSVFRATEQQRLNQWQALHSTCFVASHCEL